MAVSHHFFQSNAGSNASSISTGTGLNYSSLSSTGKIVILFLSIRNNDGIGTPVANLPPTLNGVPMTELRIQGINSAQYVIGTWYLKTADIPTSGNHAIQITRPGGAKNVDYVTFTVLASNTSEIDILDHSSDHGLSLLNTDITLDPTGKRDTELLVYDSVTLFENAQTIINDSSQAAFADLGNHIMAVGVKTVNESSSFSQGYSWSPATAQPAAGIAVLLDSGSQAHDIAASLDAAWTENGAIVPQKFFQSSMDGAWTESGNVSGGLKQLSTSISAGWTQDGSIKGQIKSFATSFDAAWTESSLDLDKDILLGASIDAGWNEQGAITFDFKWSIEHLEASTSHGFPSVYVQVSNTTQPSETFNDLVNTESVFERRLLEMPRLQEVQLDDRSGLAGFQRVTLQADNSDGLLNGLDLQDSFVRMFFVDADGDQYKEFNGKVVDWTLSHTVTINVEDLDALAFTQELPKRTLNDLVEAEKVALAEQEPALTEFKNSIVADDLGKPIPIIFGRAVKVPLLYVKADETLVMDESKREYDYIIGEGLSVNTNNDNKFKEVFTVYREDQALDNWSFNTPSMGTTTTVPLSVGDGDDPDLRRPDGWYKYWWIFGGGHIRFVTEYDSQTNTVTLDSPLPLAVSTNFPIELREWRFYPGDQSSPYPKYAFIRFKKRLGNTGSTDQLYADVNGLQEETNRAGAIASILGTARWGLGIDVDAGPAGSFTAAAGSLGPLSCEGAIINKTSVTDILQKLLSYRDMVLFKGDTIEISVDQEKSTSVHNFGLGDETGYNNILNASPSISYRHPNEKVKDLKVRYRKNHKENDTYLNELTRSSSSNGVDQTIDLPFIYEHSVADNFLDYKRKRLAASDRNLSLDIGEDGKKAKRSERVTVDIPSLGVQSDWEITNTNVTPAGSNNINLVPYSANSYSYEPFPDLPEDGSGIEDGFDIPPDFTNTPPEPVTGLTVLPMLGIVNTTPIPYFDVSWNPPDDGNYSGAIVEFSIHNENSWEGAGTHQEKTRISQGLVPGQLYDVRVTPLNITGELKGLADIQDNMGSGYLVGGDGNLPAIPQGLGAVANLGDVLFTWNRNAETTLSHYILLIHDSLLGGNVIAEEKIAQPEDLNATPEYLFKANTDELRNKKGAFSELKAVKINGNESAFTNPRVGVTTKEILQEDIKNGEVTGIATFVNASQTFSSVLGSIVMDLRGVDTVVDIDISFALDFSHGGVAVQMNITRGAGSPQFINISLLGGGSIVQPGIYHVKYIDANPTNQLTTYQVFVVSSGMSNRRIAAEERRN